MNTKSSHTPTPWFKYKLWPDRFSIGAYRHGSLCIDIGTMIPKRIVTASGDESISKEEALANVDIVIKAVNHHEELIKRLESMVYAFDDNFPEGGLYHTVLKDAREILTKINNSNDQR
jgi:hypothetical protein